MATQCLENCPRIIAARKYALSRRIALVPISFGVPFYPIMPDEIGSLGIIEAIEAAKDCHGPVVEGVREVKKGLRRKPTTEIVWMCGLEPESAPSTIVGAGGVTFSKR